MERIILDYKPHKNQRIFHNSKVKFRAYVGGIGSGKTLAGCIETIKFIIKNPGCLFVIAAPTYPMLRDSTLRTFFQICPKNLIKNYNSTEGVIDIINGSTILCRNCEDVRAVERLRGTNLSGFWIDEAARVPQMAWRIFLGRLRQPNMQLKGWITTSPRGFNWVYEEFVEKKRKEYELIPCSSRENPYLTPEYIRDLEESYPGLFAKQEIEGQFIGHEGLVYQDFNRRIHILTKARINIKRYIAGIDWGYTNPAVILIIGEDYDGRLYIVEEFYRSKMMMEEFLKIADDKGKSYKVERWFCDPSEPQFIQQFRNAGFPILAGNNEVMPGINKVSSYLAIRDDGKPRLFITENCLNTIMEFENYRYPDTKEGKAIQENPLKIYDHSMDALRYVIMEISKIKSTKFFIAGGPKRNV